MSNFKEDNLQDKHQHGFQEEHQDGLQDELQERLSQSREDDVNTVAKDEPKSAYEACVLSEAAKVHALIAKAQQEARERALKGE